MVKKMISRLSVLIVLAVFLAACSSKSEYTNVIPADASAVASINLKTLIEKAGLNDKENEAAKKKILEALKSGMNAAAFQQFEKIMQSPAESGLDVTAPLYVFTSPDFVYPTLVAKVNNKDNLTALLETMAKEQVCQPLTETDGINFANMNGTLLAFNATTVLIASPQGKTKMEEIQKTIINQMKQTAENSVNKSGAFHRMEKQKNDINFFASMAAIPAAYSNQITLGLPAEVQPGDITIIGGLTFEKGKVILKTENYTENEAVKVILKKQLESFSKSNDALLKYFPSSTLIFMNMGIKGEAFYKLLYEDERFRKTVSISDAIEVKELFDSFNGDLSMGLINVTMNSAPTFIAYAEVKNDKALQAIYANKKELGLKKGEDILELGKGEYVYKNQTMNVFFGVKNNQMYATNDELLYKTVGKSVEKSVKDTPYASDMKGKNMFMVVNAEAILELPIVKMITGFGGEEVKTYVNLSSKVSFLSTSVEGETNTVELCLKDKEVNALKQIIDFAKQFAGM